MQVRRILMIFISVTLLSGCKLTQDPVVLMVGDSWGQLMCAMGTFDKVLKDKGLKKKRAECLLTTQSGSWAEDWNDKKKLKKAKKLLQTFHNLNTVYLTAGGNDLLGSWNKDMSPQETEVVLETIADHLRSIIESLSSYRDGVQIVISGYDYPNFDLLLPGDAIEAYRELYEEMGEPTVIELNSVINLFSYKMVEIANEYDNVHFVPTIGLGVHTYGNEVYGFEPKELPKPDFDNIIGGSVDVPQTRKALFNIKDTNVVDPYHLSKKGYYNYAKHIFEMKILELIR